MRDLAFVGFILALLGLGLKRPFLLVLAYVYVDTVSPQRLSYYLLNSIPLSMWVAALAMGAWAIADDKSRFSVAPRQWLMALLLAWAFYTTSHADFPVEALVKWDWVWKSMVWAIFLPFTLRTRLRLEALLLFLTLSAAAIIIVGGLKTLASGGGYGVLNLMVTTNSGLYESSTISTVAIALVPIILWLSRFGTVFPRDWRVRLFAANLIFACLLIPVGTEARTGLVCIGVLAILMLRDVKRRFLYMALVAGLGLASVPFLPQSFSTRMDTISNHETDSSAATRLAVWGWTWNYAKEHPLGGGFEAYRQNKLQVHTVTSSGGAGATEVDWRIAEDKGRAYHSSYFEMLGEQGFPGLILFLLIHGGGLVRMEILRRRWRRAEGDDPWVAPLATSLQSAQIVYLTGSLFVGIAWQPFVWMLLAAQIGLDATLARRAKKERKRILAATSPYPA
ncbi:MAG TPA: putative O-glycosylation ligase, exosortase A system-associated [Allosphingosinicella sp.]|nr:putative O-glycosylation ligase, exosortase A system-associated [Allosphingosinicella sp.]